MVRASGVWITRMIDSDLADSDLGTRRGAHLTERPGEKPRERKRMKVGMREAVACVGGKE